MRRGLHEPIVSTATNVVVCASLLGLTLATTLLGRLDLDPWNLVIALAIAAGKVTLIVLYFMHIRFSSGVPRLIAALAILWLGLILLGTMDDFVTRAWLPLPRT